jgi:branched-chain amino acid transport system permease protein
MTEILGLIGVDLPGAKQVFYGFCLLLVITLMPEGVWPWLARKLGLEKRR